MVKPKKHLGQHFLVNEEIAERIAGSLTLHKNYKRVLEIGPGMGVLTKYLIQNEQYALDVVELDSESVNFLQENYPQLSKNILEKDFLHLRLDEIFKEPFAVIGNFPYNISSQILFKVLDYKDLIPEVCGMFQKEVAERIASGPGNKTYGILSVLLQAFYNIEYLFTVEPEEFNPPPKVKSGVIRLLRNDVKSLDCDEKLFKQIIKAAFGQRRKTLRNSLKAMLLNANRVLPEKYSGQRPEQLEVADFIEITKLIANTKGI